jgi:hypothetical protein
MRTELDPRPPSQPFHQLVDRRIGQRLPPRFGEQVHEHVIRVEVSVFAMQVVTPQPDQFHRHRDGALVARLGPRAVVIDPRHDREFTLGGGSVGVPET